jgi:hypothetical protein
MTSPARSGGLLAALLIPRTGWQSVFLVGGSSHWSWQSRSSESSPSHFIFCSVQLAAAAHHAHGIHRFTRRAPGGSIVGPMAAAHLIAHHFANDVLFIFAAIPAAIASLLIAGMETVIGPKEVIHHKCGD